ncbi:MAG TPA: iron ABC transporter permease [Acidimicrobiales bacterium]|nr:iron ABC transporter permease [Acidimicrobiales bacterium]
MTPGELAGTGRALRPRELAVAGALAAVVIGVALVVGPAGVPVGGVFDTLASKIPFLGIHSTLSPIDSAVIWEIRAPRIVLGGIVGAMLATAGASYQGVFRNPLADPYLLGVAAGAGLGATLAIVRTASPSVLGINPVPLAAFAGALAAVAATYTLGRSGRRAGSGSATRLILAGVAVSSFLTAIQTFVQQRQTPALQAVYSWILGGFTTASWSQVWIITPYVVVAGSVLLVLRRQLDVLAVGDDEAHTLGVRADRVRLIAVIAATMGTAAAVSVSGLIGFVGIVVPHAIRLIVGPSYRRILPLSVICGAGFLVACDLAARTVLSPEEIPIGVVTAAVGAPFFLVVLRHLRRFE